MEEKFNACTLNERVDLAVNRGAVRSQILLFRIENPESTLLSDTLLLMNCPGQ